MNCKVCGKTADKKSSVFLFRFPKENSKCRDWADRCNLLDLFEKHGPLRFYKSFRICSEHFDAKDVVFDGRKSRLLHSAVPHRLNDRSSSPQYPDNLCRLCAREHENMTDIFGCKGKSNLEKKFKYLPQAISKDDILPLKICSECESKVNEFYDFIMDCAKAENQFRATLMLEDRKKSHRPSTSNAAN